MRDQKLVPVLLLLSALVPAQSYPGRWARKTSDCAAVPRTASDLFGSPHSPPVLDSTITIAVTSSTDDSPVTTLCPGGKYNLRITVPGRGHHYLTSTFGTFTNSICLDSQTCKNRACNCDLPPTSSCPLDDTTITNQITMPCNVTPDVPNVFSVIYVLESQITGNQRLGQLTMNFAPQGCPADACAPSSPSPPPVRPTITATLTPRNIKVQATTTLQATITGGNPPGAQGKRVRITVASPDIARCFPANPIVNASNQVQTTCRGLKAGRTAISVVYSGVRRQVILVVRS